MDSELIEKLRHVLSLAVAKLGRLPTAAEVGDDLFARLRAGYAASASANLNMAVDALQVLRDHAEAPVVADCAMCGCRGGKWRTQGYGKQEGVYFHYSGVRVCVRCMMCGQQTLDTAIGNEVTRLPILVHLVGTWNERQHAILSSRAANDPSPPALNIGEQGVRRLQL